MLCWGCRVLGCDAFRLGLRVKDVSSAASPLLWGEVACLSGTSLQDRVPDVLRRREGKAGRFVLPKCGQDLKLL